MNPDETKDHAARLFIALWPGAELGRALAAWCPAGAGAAAARPVAPDRLHLTLHFLGNLRRARLPELVAALQWPFDPFELGFSRCERWPHGLVVAQPDAVPPPLAQLHAALGRALDRLGLPVEDRPFRPHVTLARRHPGPLQATLRAPLHWPVQGYVLAESRTGPCGGYATLHAYA